MYAATLNRRPPSPDRSGSDTTQVRPRAVTCLYETTMVILIRVSFMVIGLGVSNRTVQEVQNGYSVFLYTYAYIALTCEEAME